MHLILHVEHLMHIYSLANDEKRLINLTTASKGLTTTIFFSTLYKEVHSKEERFTMRILTNFVKKCFQATKEQCLCL